MGSDTLHQAVAKAANTVIDQKGLEGKPHSRVVQVMDTEVSSLKSRQLVISSQKVKYT